MSEPIPGHLRAVVDAAASGPVELCTVDEAQMLAIGWLSPGRGSGMSYAGATSPFDFPGLPSAQERLREAGLGATGAVDSPAQMSATGRLRDYLDLVTRHRLHTATWGSWAYQGPASSARLIRRLTPVRDTEVTVVERMHVPESADPDEPLRIEISVATLDSAAGELAGLAFRGPATDAERASAAGVESVYVGPDRKLATFPSRLVRLWDKPEAVLHWYAFSLFGRRSPGERLGRTAARNPRMTSERYRMHLLRRMRTPEPALG